MEFNAQSQRVVTEKQPSSPRPLPMVNIVSSMLSTVEGNSARMQRVYLDSESKRVELEERLRLTSGHLSVEANRASSAEATCDALDGSLRACEARLQNALAQTAQVNDDYRALQAENVKLQERYDASAKLLRDFENDQDQRSMEWQQALDIAQEEVRQLKVAKSELLAKGELADTWKSKFWDSERQLRTKTVEVQEMVARIRVLEHRLASTATELQETKMHYDVEHANAIKAERSARSYQRELLTEQLRAKQLEGIAEMYKRRWDSAVKPASGPVPALSGVVEERDILRDDMHQLVGRIASVQAEVQLCHERKAEDDRTLAALRKQLEEAACTCQQNGTALDGIPSLRHSTAPVDPLTPVMGAVRSTTAMNDVVGNKRLMSADELRSTLLVCEHRNSQLELKVAEQNEEFHRVKASSLKLAQQVETLMTSVDHALEKQKVAEMEANTCRARMTEGLRLQLEAEYVQAAVEERLQFADATIVRLLSALANAEALAITSTGEVEKWRSVCHATKVELERVVHAEEVGAAQREQLRQSALVSAAACVDAKRQLLVADECSARLQCQLDGLDCLMDEVIHAERLTLRASVAAQRAFTASLDANFQASAQRLSVLTGDFADDEMDDIVQYVRTSASSVKAAVSACDDVLHNPPVFYATLLRPLPTTSTSLPNTSTMLLNLSDVLWGAYGDPSRFQSSGLLSSIRELAVFECAFRQQLAAEESAASLDVFAAVACFLGGCVDYKEQINRTTLQLQRASEGAANLFRALKVLGLKQHRRTRVAHKYRELETINHTLWARSQEIQEILWTIMDDPHVQHRTRTVIQQRLEHLTSVTVPVPSSEPGSPTDSQRGQFPTGDAFAQLKLENEHLLEESAMLSRRVADVEARCTSLSTSLVASEQRCDAIALSASLSQAQSPSRAADDGGVHGSQQVQSLRGALTTLTVAHQRQETILAAQSATCRRLLMYMENCMLAVHYIATCNVFDVCVLASFMAVLQRAGGGTASYGEANPGGSAAMLQLAKDTCALVVAATTTATCDLSQRDSTLHDVGVQTAAVTTTALRGDNGNNNDGTRTSSGGDATGMRRSGSHHGDASLFERLVHDEETTRLLLREHAFRVLSLQLHHAMVQAIAFLQVESERRQAELSQSHAEAEGAIHMDYKRQMIGYAKAVEDCNHRLHAFMKAKSASDQECARLRSELKRAQEEAATVKRSSFVHEERSGELELRYVDLEERYRHLVKDREQLSRRLAGVLEHNRMLGKGFGLATLPQQEHQSAHHHHHHHERTAGTFSQDHHNASVQTDDSGAPQNEYRVVSSVPVTPTAPRGSHRSTVASEAAAAFTPFMNDIWFGHRPVSPSTPAIAKPHSPDSSGALAAARRAPSTIDQSVEGASVVQQHLNQLRLHNHPSSLQMATNASEASSRGYGSLAEWDAVLAKKAEDFLHKEVEWSVKERQLMVLEKELDARIIATSRECVGLRFALQDARMKLDTTLRVTRRLLASRRERQLHLALAESCIMAREDHDASSSSSSGRTDANCRAGSPSTAAAASDVHMPNLPVATPLPARLPIVGGWWAATKDVFSQKSGHRAANSCQ